ncbi:MAG TPA: universal stress protein [Terracidiphilus sp.]|nr:universal stress protein [Terracidiphilus sp.]
MRILLPVDGSEHSYAAVEALIARPWPSGTQVEVLSVAHSAPEFIDTMLVGRDLHLQTLKRAVKQAEENVERAAEAIARATHLLAATTKVVEGTPRDAILQEAAEWDADLIMMGSQGLGAALRFLLGSVSGAVALHAPCSVEIVRKRAEKPTT